MLATGLTIQVSPSTPPYLFLQIYEIITLNSVSISEWVVWFTGSSRAGWEKEIIFLSSFHKGIYSLMPILPFSCCYRASTMISERDAQYTKLWPCCCVHCVISCDPWIFLYQCTADQGQLLCSQAISYSQWNEDNNSNNEKAEEISRILEKSGREFNFTAREDAFLTLY
jgi:hypothetical protein